MTMRVMRALAVMFVALNGGTAAQAASATECTVDRICYCVNQDIKNDIANRVTEIRSRIEEQRKLGKAIGYLSIPISTLGGGYEGLNAKVAADTIDRIERRFGGSRCGCFTRPPKR
jgi:hypothetical protein